MPSIICRSTAGSLRPLPAICSASKIAGYKNVRFVPRSTCGFTLMRQYADKCFYSIEDFGYIFTDKYGKRLTGEAIYEFHRKFLDEAGIPYLGEGHGPRVHDWRHTFAVRAFKQLIDNGTDLYVALPVLSTYLGHKTIFATEKYLRLTVSIYPYIEEKWEACINDVFGKAVSYEKD